MPRVPHKIRRNHCTEAPSSILAVHCASWPYSVPPTHQTIAHKFRLGHAVHCRLEAGRVTRQSECAFDKAEVFFDFLSGKLDKHRPLWLFCCGLLFQWRILDGFKVIEDNGPSAWRAVLRSPPTILRGVLRGCRLWAVDTANYVEAGLKDLANAAGLHSLLLPHWTALDSSWRDYCRGAAQAASYLATGIVQYCRDADYGGWAPTVSGIAMHAWRHADNHPLPVLHANPRAECLERRAYVGGECYAKQLGLVRGPLYLCDVNSLYPSVMERYPYPVRLVCTAHRPTLGYVAKALRSHVVIAGCWLKTNDPLYPKRQWIESDPTSGVGGPALVEPDRLGRTRTYWPTGTFHTTLVGLELQRAIDSGHVLAVTSCAIYEAADLFSLFVRQHWRARREHRRQGNALLAQFEKAILNSLYGKIGQTVSERIQDGRVEPPFSWGQWWYRDPKTDQWTESQVIAGMVFAVNHRQLGPQSFPAISALVTSNGRSVMHDMRRCVGREHDYYGDTDSVITDQYGLDQLLLNGWVRPKELGYLKIVRECGSVVVHNVKDYVADGEPTISGIRNPGRPERDGSYRDWIMESCGAFVDRMAFAERVILTAGEEGRSVEGLPPPQDHILQYERRSRLSRVYRKGAVTESGAVLPYRLDHSPDGYPPRRLPSGQAAADSEEMVLGEVLPPQPTSQDAPRVAGLLNRTSPHT